MNKTMLVVFSAVLFGGCVMSKGGSTKVVELKESSIVEKTKANELALAKEKSRQEEIAAKNKKELAEVEERKKLAEKEAEEQKARQLEEKRKLVELERRRYDKVLEGRNNSKQEAKIDFKSEIAWAERPFVATHPFDEPGAYAASTGTVLNRRHETLLRAEYIRLLRMLDGGKDIEQRDWTNIVVGAAAVGRVNVLKWAFPKVSKIDIVSDLDSLKRTPLLWALGGDNPEMLNLIWSFRPRYDIYDSFGATPLHYAVRHCGACDVSVCIALDTNMVNVTDNEGRSPIFDAIDRSRIDIAKLLLETGADVNQKAKSGVVPFAYACGKGELAFLELMESFGATPTASDFATACEGNHVEVVKWFVEKRYFSVNNAGILKSAQNSPAVKDYLLKHGAVE